MRVLVCGGRNFDRFDAWEWLERNAYDEIAYKTGCFSSVSLEAIIQGGARGADQGAADWGKSEGVKVMEFKANWKKHGKAAGPIRNSKMIKEGKPDIVIAFEGGKGTQNMISQAEAEGIPIIRVKAKTQRF